MTIFTIIVTYNGRKWVDFCLGSLRDSTVNTIPLVIDNCSTDGTLDYIREHYPEAVLFPQEKNLGFGQANNVGIRYALAHGADYCLLLNQDAAISADAIELMLAHSDGESLLSPIHMNGDGTKLDNNFRINSLNPCVELVNDLVLGNTSGSYPVEAVCAACWFMPRKLIENIGGFNPLFFHYGEDTNYCYRMKFHQRPILLVPQARMFHDRVDFGNKSVYDSMWLSSAVLYAATNINLGKGTIVRSFLWLLWRCYSEKKPQGLYKAGNYLLVMNKLLFNYSKIQRSRSVEKTLGAHWL